MTKDKHTITQGIHEKKFIGKGKKVERDRDTEEREWVWVELVS